MNEMGEVKGAGPAWGCLRFGLAGHDYLTCPKCLEIFAAVMGHRRKEKGDD